jgi:undecaprenyl pyrophosphate synthase
MGEWPFSFNSALLESISFGFQRQLLDTHGVRLNVLGKTELLPASVQAAVRKAEDMTRHNDRCVVLFILPQG